MTIGFFIEIAAMFFIPLAAVIIPVLVGQSVGVRHSKKQANIPHESVGTIVTAAFGLVAFMLAFTFQIASNRYSTRRELLIEEVKDIRTAYLRAGLIPEPYNTNTKKYLIEYVDLRAGIAKDQSKLTQALSRSEVILDSMWKYTEVLAAQDRSSEVYALYTTAINDMVDTYNERINMILVYRIPWVVMVALTIIVVLTMLILGYQFGVSGKKIYFLSFLLAFLFSVVMFLIFALDRPETGIIKIKQNPLFDLQKQLHENNKMPQ